VIRRILGYWKERCRRKNRVSWTDSNMTGEREEMEVKADGRRD